MKTFEMETRASSRAIEGQRVIEAWLRAELKIGKA
jgi:hypothetical protein